MRHVLFVGPLVLVITNRWIPFTIQSLTQVNYVVASTTKGAPLSVLLKHLK